MLFKSLNCLLLVSCCVATRAGRRDGKADWNDMKTWLTSKGAYFHDGIEGGRMMPHGGYDIRSMVATAAFPEEPTTLFTIPRDVAIETRNHPEFHNAPLKELPGCGTLKETYVEDVRLAGVIAVETQKGSQSKYSMYLQQLPTLADYQSFHPRFMEASLQKEWAELPVVHGAQEQQALDANFKKCFLDWKHSAGSPVAMVSWEQFLLGLTHFQNRMISAQGNNFMIPGMDLVNTDPRKVNTQWQLVHMGDQGEHFALSGYAIEPGQEVFVDYCSDCDNQEMLLKWGVYLEDNPNELAYEHTTVHCADKVEGNATGALTLREQSESVLNMKELDKAREQGWRAPRCDSEKLGKEQSPLQCSMARLAFESCADLWSPGFKRESQGFQLPWNWVNKSGHRPAHPPRSIQIMNASGIPKNRKTGNRQSSATKGFLQASSIQM